MCLGAIRIYDPQSYYTSLLQRVRVILAQLVDSALGTCKAVHIEWMDHQEKVMATVPLVMDQPFTAVLRYEE